ncbi:MAG: 50S ribosomal protein L4 [Armatimonadetes bacterium]|nr:50S ribosomal protein L4 [Armatimonadota bacterium]MCX7967357.1 50S ribosomal protein L4 [Armatimonadota bacterium]MDW8144055.1 50S ribosomal protein L4 [Armatimonadota bacterium]
MELPIYNLDGERVGTYTVSDELVEGEINIPLLHQVVVAHLANKRQGTHSTKTRGEVRGGGRKPWSQKGTGRARQGSIRAPQWVGGGIVHGPKPRDYDQKVNKRVRKTAIRMAWIAKLQEGQVYLVEGLDEIDEPKTRVFKNLLDKLGLRDRKVLLLLPEKKEVLLKSTDNLSNIDRLPVLQPSTYDLLVHNAILTTPQAFEAVVKRRLEKANVR